MSWGPRAPEEIEAESFRRIEAQVGSHHFDGDSLVELPVVTPRQIHRAHSAASQQPLGHVGTESLSRLGQISVAGV